MRLSSDTERRIVTVVPPLLVGLLALPFVLRQNSWWEWNTAFWLLERQTAHVSAHGVPTFFVHGDAAAFNPFFVFYAGFLFSLMAYPAAVLGAWPVFAGVSVAALMAGYLGIWWTARNLGLSLRLAVLPALAFATTPYLLSDLYGRGAWAELIAINAAAVLLGGLTALLWHPDRRRGRALAALAGAGAVIAGSHNLTLLLSTLALPLLIAALLPLVPRAGGPTETVRRLGAGVLAIATGVGLTGAWLVPNLWLGSQTYAADPKLNAPMLVGNPDLVGLSNVLSPWPSVPASYSGRWVYTQPPVLALLWALVALLAIGWTRRRAPDRILATGAALIVLGGGLLALVVDPRWWLSFPRLLQAVQFQYRLIPYLAITIALAVSVALTALGRGRGRSWMIGALTIVVLAQATMAVFAVTNSQAGPPFSQLRHGDIHAGKAPQSFASPAYPVEQQFFVMGRPTGPGSFNLVGHQTGNVTASDAVTVRGRAAAGSSLVLPVAWSPMVRLTGDARMTGRSVGGLVVATITRTGRGDDWAISARSKCTNLLCLDAVHGRAPWQLLAGRLLSLLSVLTIVAVAARRLRSRRRGATAPPDRPATVVVEDAAVPAPTAT